MQLVIISGLSGAGKSVALRVLEDLGYYCVDNLPVNLLNQFVRTVGDRNQNVAVSVDIRNLPNDPELVTNALAQLRAEINLTLFFFDASQETLLKRYSETRRIHPLSLNEDKLSLDQAIMEEKSQIDYLKELSDLVIDSSGQSIHDLSELIRMRVLGRERQELVMVFESFGFKYGIPTDADYVFDVRFLPNPHWEPSLRPFTGLDKPVIDYLEAQPSVVELKADIQAYIEKWLPMLEKNNRSYLTVAIGCTGGKHRSVYLTHALGELFKQSGKQVQIRHTSLEKIANPL
ncbi:RNase adapter RapZ [Vibrio sp. SCSIO 43137]|uniref:RNase adapter RapZ n=1 Tax=Vibrio sp. SCSIO 43137 TaxID=3021011 RepID=UPI002307ABA6|nr:RNase adapter RapZ [Vibrio sp. SCSIO 43137]WCE31195.1 RNase adapter RapZ [Vibrio sp. SCSIO 43137]